MDEPFQESRAKQGSAHDNGKPAAFFDGSSSRRRAVSLTFSDQLVIAETGADPVLWTYADIRQVDGPGMLRVMCVTAPPLARLEIQDPAIAAELISRCGRLGEDRPNGRAIAKIVGWSLAAVVSIIIVVVFAIPLLADRLAPMVPASIERRLGDAADAQIKVIFGKQTCDASAGQLAFGNLMRKLRDAAGLDTSVESSVVATPVPNAMALPGGKVVVFNGLLAKADSPDEIAGVLAHELGHLKHRDNLRNLIHTSGTSFLVGLLFGDITGAGTVVLASRLLITSSYSREVEQSADDFSIEVMRKLGRSPKPMGELLYRITGKQGDNPVSIVASHPLSEDRLKRLSDADQAPTGPALLTPEEWKSLKAICSSKTG